MNKMAPALRSRRRSQQQRISAERVDGDASIVSNGGDDDVDGAVGSSSSAPYREAGGDDGVGRQPQRKRVKRRSSLDSATDGGDSFLVDVALSSRRRSVSGIASARRESTRSNSNRSSRTAAIAAAAAAATPVNPSSSTSVSGGYPEVSDIMVRRSRRLSSRNDEGSVDPPRTLDEELQDVVMGDIDSANSDVPAANGHKIFCDEKTVDGGSGFVAKINGAEQPVQSEQPGQPEELGKRQRQRQQQQQQPLHTEQQIEANSRVDGDPLSLSSSDDRDHNPAPTVPSSSGSSDYSLDPRLSLGDASSHQHAHGKREIPFSDTCPHVDSMLRFARIHRKLQDPSRWSCCQCGSTESAWACLDCGRVHCGRYAEGHAEDHFDESRKTHGLVIDVNRDIVHCYICDAYIANDNSGEELKQIRELLRQSRQAADDDIYASDADSTHRRARQRGFERLDKLQTILHRWQDIRLARAFARWREVVIEAKAQREGGGQGHEQQQQQQPQQQAALDLQGYKNKEPMLTRLPSRGPLMLPPTPAGLQIIAPREVTFEQMRLRRAMAWRITQQRSERSSFVPGQAGLRNIGNTCFMNSVLQSLSYVPEFRDFFVNVLLPPPSELSLAQRSTSSALSKVAELHGRPSATVRIGQHTFSRQGTIECMRSIQERKLPQLDQVSVCMQLHELLRVLWSGGWSVVTPFNLHQALQKFVPKFRGFKQQDAHEFLCYLLDRVHTELVTDVAEIESFGDDRDASGGIGLRSRRESALAAMGISNSLAAIGKKSIVTDLFAGQILSRVRCRRCGDISEKRDDMLDLQLQIPEEFVKVGRARRRRTRATDDIEMGDGPDCSLQDLLRDFVRAEPLLDRVRYCENCRSHEDADKWSTFDSPANILCVVVNRFYFTATSRAKICTDIAFPLRSLDLTPYCTGGTEDYNGSASGASRGRLDKPASAIYDLMSIVCHHGSSVESGHYTAYCWNPEDDMWFHYNDARVMVAKEADVAAAQPYIMIYERRDVPGLGAGASLPPRSHLPLPKLPAARTLGGPTSRGILAAPKHGVFSANRARHYLDKSREASSK